MCKEVSNSFFERWEKKEGFRLRATKGLSDRPLETFGMHIKENIGMCKGANFRPLEILWNMQ